MDAVNLMVALKVHSNFATTIVIATIKCFTVVHLMFNLLLTLQVVRYCLFVVSIMSEG